ncbi:4Fe-4S dicluster domain-containing protein [Candidatus Cryosericum hinesii]|jgi:NADH-quinone oxidoreductase subunit G/NADP-reducing hydrogenase subunit HndD|uniref:4Fe-4S dicluster domain-containing protein n=2 Tax=Candidatus Cryosericum hinesii TaxID=2290915 RepID=A0A398DFM3_9BACT|nr:4Fe-4S dicluster domain-containing protein [Candidatus Cryosericum hinesii]RIE14436.1 4Fe-4S dicluster domain-containing protein [Candidatus Cryosericum hinesii]RIE14580.1 4Fe-4S dicluster domain-containing protein [Candidatus Cryosericum hinesii]
METRMLNLKINGRDYQVPEGTTILKAARDYAKIDVPTLCYLEGISEEGACAICVVEVKGARNLQRACVVKVNEGMEVWTNTARVREARKLNVELLLANHPKDCFTCERSQNCDLRELASELGVREVEFPRTSTEWLPIDNTSLSLVRDPNKCVLCRRCVNVCAKVQSVYAIDIMGRGSNSTVSTFLDEGLGNVECVNCGQCLLVCPTGAITERSEIPDVWKALGDPDKVVVVETAPAVRVAIGEEFGMPDGTQATGKMTAALRGLGFDKVFDTDFSADLTIMEEGFELIGRIKNGGTLPLITSCSPGWVKFVETFFPKVLDHVSTCKSPQQMFGTVTKTYWAEKMGIDPRKIVVVSVMPCTAKKFEKERPEMKTAFHYWQEKMGLKDEEAFKDVDCVLTTREAAKMIREAGIDFANLPDEDFDKPLGESSGAGVIFGATGGVMEAALRTAYEVLTKKSLAKLDFEDVRGLEGIKSADIDIDGTILKVAVANGLGNARVLMEQVQKGESPYHFIEIMCCPGGCLGGGGQPISKNPDIKKRRAEAIYREDAGKPIRKSHENPEITTIYKDFLGEPNSEKAHHLLHTEYCDRSCK